MYNEAITTKIRSLGDAVPLRARNICGFVDAMQLPVARPKDVGNAVNTQRVLYNGKDKVHALKFQGTSSPDGMLMHLFGPDVGRRHDLQIFNKSRINSQMRLLQAGNLDQYILYSDKAYQNKSHSIAAHLGANLNQNMRRKNAILKYQRVGVEWVFGTITAHHKFLDWTRQLQIQKSPIGMYYILCALLTNCRTCLHRGNGTCAVYWDVPPPTFMEYLQLPHDYEPAVA